MLQTSQQLTYKDRIAALREAKMAQTQEKIEVLTSMDFDDHAIILPPPEFRKIEKTISASGLPVTDCLFEGYEIISNHPSGGFFGTKACGNNFRRLLEFHPVYIDPHSSLAGGYMVNFMPYRKPQWNPDFKYEALKAEQEKYKLVAGIGGSQHFCQDLSIGLTLGWGGILEKIRFYRNQNAPHGADFYEGLEDIVLGIQNLLQRTASAARRMAQEEKNPQLQANLLEMAEINYKLVDQPPDTLREACQWILWYQTLARMYNSSGSLGRFDVLLYPYYLEAKANGMSDEEVIFHIACLLVRDTGYSQLGGPDADGNDVTNPLSYLILEAAHQLKIPANIGVSVGEHVDSNLLRRGVEIMFEDRTGVPKFLGVENTAGDFAKNGYPIELGRQRAYSGCHWSAIPGREYTMNDIIKVNFAAIFEYAFDEMMADEQTTPSTAELWQRFEMHLDKSIDILAKGIDFHMEHMEDVFPELMLDLLCYGPIEKGLDASNGGLEFYNICVDGSALATVADSFAALEQRIEMEGRLSWQEIRTHLLNNWEGMDGEKTRLMMRNIPRYGSGGSRADEYAQQIARTFTHQVTEKTTPNGYKMIPGLFSWANTIPMGKEVGATPNGRRAGEPISHGSNPDPGYRKDGAPTAMAVAIASVQPRFGNAAPMQIELEPSISKDEGGVDNIMNLIQTHFRLGGTQINMNLLDAQKVLEANEDPSKYPDLVVRVTGFSAYFASLSPEFRQLVVDRILREGA